MSTRFEDDMAELSADGNYLMLCGGRRRLFLDGAVEGNWPISEVEGFVWNDGSIVVRSPGGEERACSFPSIEDGPGVVERLNGCLAAWGS